MKCFAALSQRPILVFLPPIDAWLYAESSLQCLNILPSKCVQVLCKPVSSSVCLDPTHFLLVGLCGATRIVSHRSRVQTVPCFHLYSNNHRWLPHEVHQCSFSFFSGHQCNSQEKGSFVVGAMYVTSLNTPEIWSSFNIWTWISGLLLLHSEEISCDSRLRSLHALCTAVDNGCPSCEISPVLQGNTHLLSLFFECPHLLISIFECEFQMVALF